MVLNFTIKNQTLAINKAQSDIKLVAGSKNYITLRFAFLSSEWKNASIIYALFTYKNKTYKRILGSEENLAFNECSIPPEVNIAPGFSVSLVCDDQIDTNMVYIELGASNQTNSIENQQSTPTIMEQMNTLMYKYANLCNQILKECQKIEQNIKNLQKEENE